MRIGSLTLGSEYSLAVKVSYDYIRSSSQEIIGGLTVYTITGKFIVKDGGAKKVMSMLSAVRALGASSECVNVSIDGFYSGPAKITNVNIDQGADPSWINKGEFSIELKSSLTTLPVNTLGLVASDYVTDISISETLEIGEESHSFYYGDGGYSKEFVKFTNKINITCRPLCSAEGTPLSKSTAVLNKVLKLGPSSAAFKEYSSWTQYLQSRTMEINTEGGITFTASIILVPKTSKFPSSLVDISFSHSENYQEKSSRFIVSGTVNGLVSVPWTNLISLGNTSSVSKLSGAESAFSDIKSRFTSLSMVGGQRLQAIQRPNCPIQNIINSICAISSSPSNCIEPLTTSVSKSRIEGTITFNFEWGISQQGECISNGRKTEITIDVQAPQPQFIEHIIPRYGTIIQDLNCRSAKKVTYTSTTTAENSSCSNLLECSPTTTDEALNLSKYLQGTFLLIGSSITKTRTSYIVKQEYIEKDCT